MSTIQKSYVYKVYDNTGLYLGNLPTPSSDFSYTLDINTAGSTLSITCPINVDVSNQAPPYLTTEDGTIITTEDGTYITATHPAEIIAAGDTPGNFLFRNGNKIKVYEISKNNINGTIVFRGRIERLEASFGSDNQDEAITILVYGDGTDLGNYVVPGSNANFSDQSQLSTGDDVGFWYGEKFGQIFVTGSGVTNLSAIKLRLIANSSGPRNVMLNIWSSPNAAVPGSTPLISVNIVVDYSVSFVDTIINLPVPISVSPNTPYFFSVETPDIASIFGDVNTWAGIDGANNSGYSSAAYVLTGSVWRQISNNYAICFTTYFSDFTVDRTFTAQDPSTILKSAIDTYVSSGGLINYSAGTVDLTGISVTYTFSLATIFDAIQKCLELAPFGFYWYVDPGTNTLYFKQTSTGADIKLTKGAQIDDLTLVMTTENISNLEYFSGGNGGSGPNLFKQYSDQTSIQEYGVRLNLQSDNRVTLDATADTLGAAFIAENKDEQFQTTVTVSSANIDTTTLKPGLNVGFNGFGTFIDILVLQIVEIIYGPEEVTMTLGRIPPRMHQTLQAAANAIAALQTIDNPSAPS